MRIVFCDDNETILKQLTMYITDFFRSFGGSEPEYAAYSSGEALLAVEKRVDIAFLDVEMPGVSGIRVGVALKAFNPQIKIFIVTSYSDYLDEAMRFQVFRYLSKPIDKNRLFRNLKDAVAQINMESKEYAIETSDGVAVRRSEEIVCVETLQRKVFVYTTDNVYSSTEPLEYWRRTLSLPCFFSPHRSFIVNMRFVYTIGRDNVLLRYGKQTKEVFVSRRKYTQFKNAYLMYMESVK